MHKICTSLEQSQKLIELGIDINTADMLWTYDFTVNDINGLNVISKHLKPEENDIPCWSLAALLDYLSANFRVDIKYLDNYWELDCRVQVTYNKELIDACYEMIITLHEQKIL